MGQHGLTPDEIRFRQNRAHARSIFYWAQNLHRRLADGKAGKGAKGRRPLESGKGEPIRWENLSVNYRWCMQEYMNGNLKRRKEKAESNYHGDQAGDFELHSE